MATRVTPEEIVRIHQLYAKYGNFAAGTREVGRSSSTVAKLYPYEGNTDDCEAHF